MFHFINLIAKWALAFLILFVVSLFFAGFNLTNMLVLSSMVAVISYVLGDLFVLPKTGNLMATIGDFGLAFLILWALAMIFAPLITIGALLVATVGIAVSEFFFHIYMENRLREIEREKTSPK